MASLKDFITAKKAGRKIPGVEQKFIDAHTVDKKEDRNGNKDDVFTASNVKVSKTAVNKKVAEALTLAAKERVALRKNSDAKKHVKTGKSYHNYDPKAIKDARKISSKMPGGVSEMTREEKIKTLKEAFSTKTNYDEYAKKAKEHGDLRRTIDAIKAIKKKEPVKKGLKKSWEGYVANFSDFLDESYDHDRACVYHERACASLKKIEEYLDHNKATADKQEAKQADSDYEPYISYWKLKDVANRLENMEEELGKACAEQAAYDARDKKLEGTKG